MENNNEVILEKIKLTNLQRVKQWEKEIPEKLALQKHRRYVWFKRV